MTELKELKYADHGELKVDTGCTMGYASKAHVMSLRATEVAKMATSLPVFITKNQFNGHWNISAITSVQPGRNLFVEQDKWTAAYQPNCMKTHPLYLMNSPSEANSYTVGIDPNSPDFSSVSGEALFDENGKATPYLSQISRLLEADIEHSIQTHQFLEAIAALDLIKPIDLIVQYQSGSANTIQGLNTIDEEKLQSLTAEQLHRLNQQGYLNPIHALLFSILQLNVLVQKNNAIETLEHIAQIKLETRKDKTAF